MKNELIHAYHKQIANATGHSAAAAVQRIMLSIQPLMLYIGSKRS